jgi:diacylglycerol kinase family enzyme
VKETNKLGYLNGNGRKCQSPAKKKVKCLFPSKRLRPLLLRRENAAEVIRLATTAAFGKWRDDRKVHLTKTKRLAVRPSKEISATLDAESVNRGMRAEFDFVSRAVTILVPAK